MLGEGGGADYECAEEVMAGGGWGDLEEDCGEGGGAANSSIID